MYVPGACGNQRHVRSPVTRVTDSCKPPRDCWELNQGLLKEHQVL